MAFGDHALKDHFRSQVCSHLAPQLAFMRKALMIFLTETIILAAKDPVLSDSSSTDLKMIMCQLSDAKYEQAITPIMEGTKKALRTTIEENNQSRVGKLYWNQDMSCCLTHPSGERMYNCLKKVWFTETEYDELKGAELGAQWKSRFKRAMWDMPSAKEHCLCDS